jgi:hypothetical protein
MGRFELRRFLSGLLVSASPFCGDEWCWMVGFEWMRFPSGLRVLQHRCYGGISMAYGWCRNELLGR